MSTTNPAVHSNHRRRGRLRAVISAGGALLATACLAACGSSHSSHSTGAAAAGGSNAGSTAAKGGATTKVTIAYTAPIADQMLAEVTQAAGLFKKNGIDADIKFVQASSVLAAMAAGQVQFTIVGAPSAEIATVNGTPLTYIGQWEHVIDADIAATSKAPTIKDMSGKTVAISSTGALSDFLVQIAQQKYGVTMHAVPLGQLPNQLTAYSKGSVDALSGVNPWSISALKKAQPSTHVIADFRTVKGYPGVGLVASSKYLSSSGGATAVKVLKAMQEGLAYYKAHPSQSIAVISKYTDEPKAEATQAYAQSKAVMTRDLVPTLSDQQNVLKALQTTQPKAKGFDASKLLNASYAKQAAGQ